MSNSNSLTNLVAHLAKARTEGVNISRLTVSKLNTDLTATRSSGSAKPAASPETRSQPISSAGFTHDGLRFGSPSSNRTAAAPGTSEWTNLLKQTASGGLAAAFGGGSLLSAVSGIGGLVSSIVGLFGGGHKTPASLSLFTLDSAQNQNVSVNVAQNVTQTTSSGGIYGTQPATSSTTELDHQPYQFQSAQIAQAVKQALLNSSSLNDVIAEI